MASYQGHLSFASVLAAGYGAAGVWSWGHDWGDAGLAAGLVVVGGMLPDLDSDSGVPVRELFGIAAVVGALLAYARLRHGLNHEQAIVIAAGIYLFIRYVVARFFKWATVHRGMWHSVPAMLIAGLGVYLLSPCEETSHRYFLAGAVMVGFLSHLVLDELYAVNISGVTIKLNQFAGSAVKFFSKSILANAICYGILAGMVWVAHKEADLMPTEPPPAVQKPKRRLMGPNGSNWNRPWRSPGEAGSSAP